MEQDKLHQSESGKSVSVNFEWQIDKLLAAERYTDAFEVCLEEVKKNKNYSSINWKIDVVISKLKNKIHIPSFFTNINPSWLIDRLTAKGYSKLERKDDIVNWKKIAINISQINHQKHEIKTTSSLKPILKYAIIITYVIVLAYVLLHIYIIYIMYLCWADYDNYALIMGLKGLIFPTIIVFGLTFLLFKFVIPYFKRKKKLIRDIAEICLEECER